MVMRRIGPGPIQNLHSRISIPTVILAVILATSIAWGPPLSSHLDNVHLRGSPAAAVTCQRHLPSEVDARPSCPRACPSLCVATCTTRTSRPTIPIVASGTAVLVVDLVDVQSIQGIQQ